MDAVHPVNLPAQPVVIAFVQHCARMQNEINKEDINAASTFNNHRPCADEHHSMGSQTSQYITTNRGNYRRQQP
jgi:hypothetical protein